MIYERLILWILINLVSFNWGRVIQDGSSNLHPINDALKIQDRITSKKNDFEISVKIREVCTDNCKKKMPDVSEQNKKNDITCPYEKKEMCLILSLSKIAKIQVANPNRDSTVNSFALNIFDAKPLQDSDKTGTEGSLPYDFIKKHFDANSLKSLTEKHVKSPNVFCRAIRDVYIPDAKKKFPAYSCQFENRTFVLSSPRFLQDRRADFGINMDEEIFRKMKINAPNKISRSNELNVIPALLILKRGNSDYSIRTYEEPPNERIVTE